MTAERLQKVLAASGIASRRASEVLIASGRVTVDGVVATIGAKVDPERSIIAVDGRVIGGAAPAAYLLLNKPPGVTSTVRDRHASRTVLDMLPTALVPEGARLYPVGRLDQDSEGLILLTNDGDLAHRLQHPAYGVLKTYLADISGPLSRDLGRRLMTGIELDDGPAIADRFHVVERAGSRALVEITLHEGRKHIVRRMLAAVGHPVSRLVRTHVGPVNLGSLRPGTTRRLTTREIGELYASVGL